MTIVRLRSSVCAEIVSCLINEINELGTISKHTVRATSGRGRDLVMQADMTNETKHRERRGESIKLSFSLFLHGLCSDVV